MTVLPAPYNLSLPVLAELVQADLITNEEREGLRDPSDVVEVQSGKSPEVLTKTAEVVLRHGFEKESNLLTGKQIQPLIHVPRMLQSSYLREPVFRCEGMWRQPPLSSSCVFLLH